MPTKSKLTAVLSFFSVNVIQGVFALSMLLRLPRSESERALIAGYSLMRLLMLASCVLGILIFIFSSIFLFVKIKDRSAQKIIHRAEKWFARNDLFLAFLLFACLLVFLVGLFIIIYMQPDLFPLSRIYMYIYERIQPHFLWFTAFCGETFILVWLVFWKSKPRVQSQGSNKIRLAAFLCLLAASIIMGFLWFLYLQHTEDYIQLIQTTLPLLILSILMLLAGVGLSNIDALGGRRAQDK